MSKNPDLDLNIKNYDLDDLLTLFKIPLNFNEKDLKRAKTIVLKTHPDKSGLPSDYFLFYSKAYKFIYNIWEFRKKGDANNSSIKNTDYNIYVDDNKKELLNNFFENNKEIKKSGEFNKWFNAEFEKNKIINEKEHKGYDEWLRKDEGLEPQKNITLATMGIEFERKKKELSSLIKYQGIEEMVSFNNSGLSASELSNDAPNCFDSDIFSGLPYQDLQKAHTESVIPVTFDDYDKREKFNSVNEYMTYRSKQDINPLKESSIILNNKYKEDESKSIRIAYELAKQTELSNLKNNEFWSNIQLLKNKVL
jgi:hypothetical protein